jgi:hypothetical protein
MTGLYEKYLVTKADGTPTDPNAVYFVLRLDTDKLARLAALRYAALVARQNPQLAQDLRQLIIQLPLPHRQGD